MLSRKADISVSGEKLRILVVEDDRDLCDLMVMAAREQGWVVDAVHDARQAMTAMEARTYAVVLSDIKMPGMDGVGLTRWIKMTSPETEVIIITAYATVDNASAAVRLGVFDYIIKPFKSIKQVMRSISRALEKYCARVQTAERVMSLERQQQFMSAILDRLPQGVVLVDREGRMLLANTSAREILKNRDGLALRRNGELVARRAAETRALRALIKNATGTVDDTTTGRQRTGGAITLSRGDNRQPLSVLVTPLFPDQVDTGHEEAVAALFVSAPEYKIETTEKMLCRLYRLTPTEARLTAILVQGKRLDQASIELGISPHTARTHLRHVFSKTSTSRQGELISLLLSGPALIRQGRGC